MIIIGLGIILYVIITGGLLIFAYLSAFGGGVSNSFNIDVIESSKCSMLFIFLFIY